MSRRSSAILGFAALGAWLVGAIFDAKAALLGWLVAFVAFSSVPVGCLALLMMLILVPGSWRKLYAKPLWLGSALLPMAALAVVPLLFGMGALYPWADAARHFSGFKGAWLSPVFFAVRQIAYWAALLGIWLALLLLPAKRSATAAVGLIAYALVSSWMGVDMAESLTPDFHSSIYGLLILGGQWLAAAGFALAIGLPGRKGIAPFSAAGVFMVALLMWAYLHAMQFLVIWSADIPEEAGWYVARGTGGWAVVTGLLFIGQGILPFFTMLSPAVRHSRTAMTAVAVTTLLMRPVESAWLLLPKHSGCLLAAGLAVVALVAMAALGWAAARFVQPAGDV